MTGEIALSVGVSTEPAPGLFNPGVCGLAFIGTTSNTHARARHRDLVFDAPGVNELVRSEWEDLLVPVGEVAALGEAAATILADRSMAAVLGSAARQQALAWPTWSFTAERFLRVLDSLLAGDAGQDTRAR